MRLIHSITRVRIQQKHLHEHGYILLYTILAASLFAVVATSILSSTLRELSVSEQSLQTIKARFAAEAALECISYWDGKDYPSTLNPISDADSRISCDTLVSSVWFDRPPAVITDECSNYSRSFVMGPFFDGDNACAEVDIIVNQNVNFSELCSVEVAATGFNDCDTREVERTVWSQQG